ncbi:MAG: polysaccharide deacetylase family protein [Verrucomicrobiota bacterium]
MVSFAHQTRTDILRTIALRCSLSAAASFFLICLCSCQVPSKAERGKKDPTLAAATPHSQRPPAGLEGPTWDKIRNTPPQSPGVGNRDSYSSVSTSLPFIALTFDDGPHPTHTPRLLDILKARNVKATFYVVGTNAKRYPEILRRMIAEGHEIGNHTITHGSITKMSPDQIRHELSVSHQTILEATGIPPRTMRPPYGAIRSDQKAWIRREFGYPSIMWNVDPEDWKKPGSSVVTQRLVSGARPGGILLVHDIHEPTIDAIPSAVDQLLRKGFQFVTVTQLIAMDGKG